MNKEKAIKILKDKTEALNKHIKNYEESDCIGSDVYRAIKEEKEALEKAIQLLEQYEKQIDYVDKNYISKEAIEIKNKELYKEYKQALLTNSTKAFILKCKIEGIDELLEGK